MMKVVVSVVMAVWALVCVAIYIFMPRWAGFSEVGQEAWYGYGWLLIGCVFLAPPVTYSWLDSRF